MCLPSRATGEQGARGGRRGQGGPAGDEAMSGIARAIRRARVGMNDPKRPIASFVFLGPSQPRAPHPPSRPLPLVCPHHVPSCPLMSPCAPSSPIATCVRGEQGAGGTGVGKTELAKSLARYYFGKEVSLSPFGDLCAERAGGGGLRWSGEGLPLSLLQCCTQSYRIYGNAFPCDIYSGWVICPLLDPTGPSPPLFDGSRPPVRKSPPPPRGRG
jgi:hypothetical protein